MVDPRVTQVENKLVASPRSRSTLPPRPDYGTEGVATCVRANYFPVALPTKTLYKYDVSMNPEPNHIYQKAFSNCWENGPSVLWKSRPQAQPNAWGYESWFSERALGIVKDPTVIVSTQSWLRCHASISRDLEGHDIYRRSGCKYGQVHRPLSGPP